MSTISSSSSLSGRLSSKNVFRTDSRRRSGPLPPQSHPSDYSLRVSSSKSGSKARALNQEAGSCLPDRAITPAPFRKYGRAGHDSKPDDAPIQTRRKIQNKLRGCRRNYSGSVSPPSRNEALACPCVILDLSHETAGFQAHQRHKQLPVEERRSNRRRLTSGQQVQVDLASPNKPVFPLPPTSPSSLSTSHQGRTVRNRAATYHSPRTSISSLPSVGSSQRASISVASGSSTPSPCFRQSHLDSPLPSRPNTPLSLLIKQGIVPSRAPPTLAMSMQIHSPTPIMSGRPVSPPTNTRESRSRSRPSSPLNSSTQLPTARPPMPRPPSRSAKLLRDTLRRAEEHDRIMSLSALPSPSIFGATQPAHGFVPPPSNVVHQSSGSRVRRNTSSSSGTDASLDAFAYCDTGACDSDEEQDAIVAEQAWLWRSPSGSSSSSGHGNASGHYYQSRPQQPRSHSNDPDRSSWPSPTSPTRMHLQRSARSAPNVPQSHSRPLPDHDHTSQHPGAAVTPHEAVLRSRLEGVLRGAKVEHDRRTRSRSRARDNSGESGSSNSLASSRNLSGEGEWFFTGAEAPYVSLPTAPMYEQHMPVTPSRTRSTTAPSIPGHQRSPSVPQTGLYTPSSPSTRHATLKQARHPSVTGPMTPPPTPPSFNARTAAAQCRAMDGYVSFANIEGLGIPDGEDHDDVEESKNQGRWLKWLMGPAKTGRGRSDSACSVASR